jgi:hypothetical protein
MPRNFPSVLKATRAAMYVRLSTEHQQYSTKNQPNVTISFGCDGFVRSVTLAMKEPFLHSITVPSHD